MASISICSFLLFALPVAYLLLERGLAGHGLQHFSLGSWDAPPLPYYCQSLDILLHMVFRAPRRQSRSSTDLGRSLLDRLELLLMQDSSF